MKAFFTGTEKQQFDFRDRDEDPMFDLAYGHLGALRFDELYGFAPGLRMGGAAIVEATHLFQIHVHMALLRSSIGDEWSAAEDAVGFLLRCTLITFVSRLTGRATSRRRR